MYAWIRPLLFGQDPETLHERVLRLLEFVSDHPALTRGLAAFRPRPASPLGQVFWGQEFPHPVGLAAGFDKDGRAVPALGALGFSFLEVGTVTPRPQPGNPRPRIFRLPSDQGLINRMGFNSAGIERVAANLRRRRDRTGVVVGLNLGVNRETVHGGAAQDFCRCLEAAWGLVDYVTVNVSSPNTPGLRDLQEPDSLRQLLRQLLQRREALAETRVRPTVGGGSEPHAGKGVPPVLVKFSPDLRDEELAPIVAAAESEGVDGYVATNTTVTRTGLRDAAAREAGGVSGVPLAALSRRMTARLYLLTGGRKPIISVGGIHSGEEAYRRIRAGASLLQVYTGLVYRGPGLVGEILRELEHALARDGLADLREAVGLDAEREAGWGWTPKVRGREAVRGVVGTDVAAV